MSWAADYSVDALIAQKKYDEAIALLEQQLGKDPANIRVRVQYGDALVSKGEKERAAKVLLGLVDQLAADGLVPQAIVALKKLKGVDPEDASREEDLADALRRAESSPLFSDFSHEELVEMIRGLELRKVDPGGIIVTEGENGDSLFILTTGAVRAFVRNREGTNKEVRRIDEGEFFGEISLLSGTPRTATITAATYCELLELDRETLDDISQRHPRVATVVKEFYVQRAGSEQERDARLT